jgi:prepilin-type N-terminal cleavage/methylation domain-containing protein
VIKQKHHKKGFSLIEVVIAVALFAMAATVLSSTFVNALLLRDRVQSNDIRNADIRAVRLQLLLTPNLDDAEDGSEIETLSNGEATWRAEIEPTNVIDLFRVELFIEFLDPQEEQEATHQETLYLLRPTWSDSSERSDLLQEKKDDLLDSRDFDSF